MKRLLKFTLAGLIAISLVGFALADTWELLEVEVGTMQQRAISSTSGPAHCKSLIDCHADPDGYGVIEVMNGSTMEYPHDASLDCDDTDEQISDDEVDFGPSCASVFRGDAGGGGTGYFNFRLNYPHNQ